MGVLRELFPLGAFLVMVAIDLLAWLVLARLTEWWGVVFVLDYVFSPLVLLSGFGWMGRGHKWIGGIVLLLRAAYSFFVLAEFNPDGGPLVGSRGDIVVPLLLFAAWIAMPIVSAWLVAVVPARQQAHLQPPASNF
jgi:hypothetical protein